MTRARHGYLTVQFRGLDVEVEYERDGDEYDWWFVDKALNNAPTTDDETTDIDDQVWEHSFT